MIRLSDAPTNMQHIIHAIAVDSQVSTAIFWCNFKLNKFSQSASYDNNTKKLEQIGRKNRIIC